MPTKKRRKPVTISRMVALRRIDHMMQLVFENVKAGLHQEATLRTGNMIVRASVRPDRYYYGAECYNTIRISMALSLALTLARLFDEGSKYRHANKRDVASIPLLIRLLRQKRCRTAMADRARGWTPNIPDLANVHAAQCEKDIQDAIDAYLSLRRSPLGRDALTRLREFRNKKLAHSLMDVVIRALPEYRQLSILMKAARVITGHAKQAVLGDNMSLEGFARERRRQAKAFWEPALTGAVTAAGLGTPVIPKRPG